MNVAHYVNILHHTSYLLHLITLGVECFLLFPNLVFAYICSKIIHLIGKLSQKIFHDTMKQTNNRTVIQAMFKQIFPVTLNKSIEHFKTRPDRVT